MWIELRNGNLVKESKGTAKTWSKRSVNQTEFLMHVQQVPRGHPFAHYQSLVSYDEQFGKMLAFIFLFSLLPCKKTWCRHCLARCQQVSRRFGCVMPGVSNLALSL